MSTPADASPFPPVAYGEWRARVAAELQAEDPEVRLGRQVDGVWVDPLYAPDHLAMPAALPRVTRAPGAWRIWQEVPVGAPGAAAALRRESARGLGGAWLRADDSELNATRVAALVEGLPAETEIAVEGACEPAALAAIVVAGARESGAEPLRGCLGGDPLGALARRGSLSGSACEQLVGMARWATDHAPGLRAALVSTAPYADAGASAVQEVAFALATGAEVLRTLTASGFAAAEAAGQVLLSLTVGRDVYLQIAKLRAMRLAWAMLLATHDVGPVTTRLHGRTASRTKGRRDPGTDLVRATLETIAAVLGGCDDVTCAPFLDEDLHLGLGLPLASATQLLLREESGLGRIADAVGGSWYTESLTATVARAAWDVFARIEAAGGMARALAIGMIAHEVTAAAERRRAAVQAKELPIVGVSAHPVHAPVLLPHRPFAGEQSDGGERVQSTSTLAQADAAAEGPRLVDELARHAMAGATLGALEGAVPAGDAPLRAPVLTAWRDEEAFAAVEANA